MHRLEDGTLCEDVFARDHVVGGRSTHFACCIVTELIERGPTTGARVDAPGVGTITD